jgi:hypothetical protein
VKVGLLARGEDRGLGIQTWEFHRNLDVERTLLIDMGELARGFPVHGDRYLYEGANTTVARFDKLGQLPERTVRDFLSGLDVVFTAETFYDWRLVKWARQMGVATVCQVNPEFYRHGADRLLEHPTTWWAPTPWYLDRLPVNTRLVGVPVATDRFPMDHPTPADQLRVVHTAGHRAAGDRNGTLQLLTALRSTRPPMTVRLLTQDARLPRNRQQPNLTVELDAGGREHYWDLYTDADVLCLPRRYGGLCLPVQEAMASGLAVVMTDTSPNDFWPTLTVPCRPRGYLNAAIGKIRYQAADHRQLAHTLDALATDPDHLHTVQAASLEWARDHSWEAMRPQYVEELEHAADRA